MINLTQEEEWAANVLNNTVKNAKEELDRAVAAKNAYIQLLESKYKVKFNPQNGKFEEIEQP